MPLFIQQINNNNDIEKMLAGNPYHRVLPTNRPKKAKEPVTKSAKAKNGMRFSDVEAVKEESEVLDYISGEEVMSIYKVKKSWLYASAKRNQVPVCCRLTILRTSQGYCSGPVNFFAFGVRKLPFCANRRPIFS